MDIIRWCVGFILFMFSMSFVIVSVILLFNWYKEKDNNEHIESVWDS